MGCAVESVYHRRMSLDSMKAAAETDVRSASDVLTSVSHELWEHPELAFEEEHAAKVCIDALSDAVAERDAG